MKTITTNIKVSARDVFKLEFDFYCNDDGLMSFSIDFDEHFGIYEILLRSILECFGVYEITGKSEYTEYYDKEQYEKDQITYRLFHTDLPKEQFLKVIGNNVYINDLKEIEDFLIRLMMH